MPCIVVSVCSAMLLRHEDNSSTAPARRISDHQRHLTSPPWSSSGGGGGGGGYVCCPVRHFPDQTSELYTHFQTLFAYLKHCKSSPRVPFQPVNTRSEMNGSSVTMENSLTHPLARSIHQSDVNFSW